MNHTLLCAELPPLWARLKRHYADTAVWWDGLSFSAEPRVAGVEAVLSSGHDTFLSLLHYQASPGRACHYVFTSIECA